jgi:hypothetical protein
MEVQGVGRRTHLLDDLRTEEDIKSLRRKLKKAIDGNDSISIKHKEEMQHT